MNGDNERIPQFAAPTPVGSAAIETLLNDGFYISSGILYHKYKTIFPVDQLQISKSNSAIFIFHDNNAFLNSRRIFAEITYYATDADGNGLSTSQFVGATAPCPHTLIDTVSVNVSRLDFDF